MDRIVITDEEPKTSFKAVKVVGKMRDGDNRTLELTHAKTGKLVLEVGTDNTDDYYPWYVASFYEENTK